RIVDPVAGTPVPVESPLMLVVDFKTQRRSKLKVFKEIDVHKDLAENLICRACIPVVVKHPYRVITITEHSRPFRQVDIFSCFIANRQGGCPEKSIAHNASA